MQVRPMRYELVRQSPAGSLEFINVNVPSSSVSNIVEAVADWDISDNDAARALAVDVLPSTVPYFVVQYREPMSSSRKFGGIRQMGVRYRHVVSTVQTGVATQIPSGAFGVISARLRPELAACILGEPIQCFANVKVGLTDIFKAKDIALLEEMVSEASNSADRIGFVTRFLLTNASRRKPDLTVSRAASLLRGNPALRVRQLASELDISERHLSRKFQSVFGTSPKQFARAARIEKALVARSHGLAWAQIAYACGFADQAHMINDFNAIVGAPPEHVFRARPAKDHSEGQRCDTDLRQKGSGQYRHGHCAHNNGNWFRWSRSSDV